MLGQFAVPFFFLACAVFANYCITSKSVMQVLVKYGSFFMALLSMLVANANLELWNRWYYTLYLSPLILNVTDNLNAWSIASTSWFIIVLLVFIVIAFIEGLSLWKSLGEQKGRDKWEMPPM